VTTDVSQPPAPVTAPDHSRGRFRRLMLGGQDDPVWARPGLWAILALAAVLYAWDLSANGDANTYYAAAVLSGTKSWQAFFYGALDSGSFITVDKPPLAFWVMGLSARIFGFGTLSMLIPQVVEGVAAVAVLYATVRKAFTNARAGHIAALIAALVFTLTPITVAINRDNNPDTMLTLLLVLSAWAFVTAIRSGRLWALVLCAVFVGLAFDTKMLQAFIVLPAFALVQLFAAPGGWRRRIGHLSAAGAALAVVGFAYPTIVDLVPASSRPYIGGSTNNSLWNLIIGYNGLGRIFGGEHPGRGGGARPAPGGGAFGRHGGGGGFGGFGQQPGIGRLFGDTLGGQIAWLIPLAVIALVAVLILRGRRPRTDLIRASVLMWGIWLVTHFVVFSFAKGTFHPYYTTAMAPAIAALAGIGGLHLFQAYRISRRWMWVLPTAVAVTGVWAIVLLRRTPGFASWLPWVIGIVTAVVVLTLLAFRLRRRFAVIAAITGFAAMLAGPAAYAVTPLSKPISGNNPLAGPSASAGPFGGRGRAMPAAMQNGRFGSGRRGGFGGFGGFGGRGGAVSKQTIAYLQSHRDGATWLVAVTSAMSAAPIILQTGGEPVMAMGGFSGGDPAPTLGQFQQYVKEGKLHYVIAGGRGFGGGRGGFGGGGFDGGGTSSQISAWVQQACTAVTGMPSLYRC
jgi:4-amino-4-deoxy-L-arabinose transferase-like glycosyltransferase